MKEKIYCLREVIGKKIKNRNEVIIYSFLCRLLLFVFMMWIIFGVIFGITSMKNSNMIPSINAGDLMLYYRLERKYVASDIIIFTKDGEEYTGRIVAKPNDKVEITDDSRVKINDSISVEGKIYYKTPKYDDYVDYPVELNENQYFVLCDYREGAKDSRYFGPISKSDIKGKVITLLRRNNL